MTDWKEYPECPYCGAIQEFGGRVLFDGPYTCHSCDKNYVLHTLLIFRTSKGEED